jgi:hypothetical protein
MDDDSEITITVMEAWRAIYAEPHHKRRIISEVAHHGKSLWIAGDFMGKRFCRISPEAELL